MKQLLLLTSILLASCNTTPYIKVGAGYKIQETSLNYVHDDGTVTGNHPVSARIQVGVKKGNCRLGIDHHSQWFTGFPFNNTPEYGKTEIFVDYEWEW